MRFLLLQASSRSTNMFLRSMSKLRAPEFPKGLAWLNGGPFSLQKLRGRVILVDFWTYSCVNCIRTLPHLKRWHEAYEKAGLVVIGVHTPEFGFEKDEQNVKDAIREFRIPYPVVLDNEYGIWQQFANRYWPRKYLISADGYIVYDHIGEGGYAETEMMIQKLLKETGVDDLPEVPPEAQGTNGVCYKTTPELYLGYLRGHIGNAKDYIPDAEEAHTDVDQHEDDVPYLHGHWKIAGECIEHARKLAIATEYLLLKYSAFSVNLVMGTADGKTADIEIELDGQPLPENMAGDDVKMRKGIATVTIDGYRMYRLVNAKAYHSGTLKLKTKHAGVQMFAFTFGGCTE